MVVVSYSRYDAFDTSLLYEGTFEDDQRIQQAGYRRNDPNME